MAKKKKKKKVPMIAQATPKHGIAYRKLPYSKTRGTAYHWRYVIRATGRARRKLIAKGIENAVECRKVKYSNKGKTNAKLYDDTKPYKFNCLKLKKKSSTNCCNLAYKANEAFTKAMSRFLGVEITSCAACFSDLMKGVE